MFNKFDRIKLKIMDVDVKKKTEAFKKSVSADLQNLYVETYNGIGLRIRINHIQQYILIDVSSKLLGKKCINLISKNNLKIIHKKINEIIEIDYNNFLDGLPNYCECTNDIKVTKYEEKVEALFNLSIVQTKFKTSPKIYKRYKKSSSFWMKKNIITNDLMEYISIYNKLNELTDRRKNENVIFLESLNQKDRTSVLNYFENILRFESKFQSKKGVREVC